MNNFKKILNFIFPYNIDIIKKLILSIIIFIIIWLGITIFIDMVLLVVSFIYWKFPRMWYFPFTIEEFYIRDRTFSLIIFVISMIFAFNLKTNKSKK